MNFFLLGGGLGGGECLGMFFLLVRGWLEVGENNNTRTDIYIYNTTAIYITIPHYKSNSPAMYLPLTS